MFPVCFKKRMKLLKRGATLLLQEKHGKHRREADFSRGGNKSIIQKNNAKGLRFNSVKKGGTEGEDEKDKELEPQIE